ncbi:MAG TPA: CPBP family intramembrane glutamic endopeptidase [Thermoanaerobaculia bacterium]
MLDMCFFLFVALLSPLPDLVLYPRMRRATEAGAPGVRSRYHLLGAASLWLLAGVAVTLAMRRPLPWSDLRLGVPSLLRLAAGTALVVAYGVLALRQRRALLAKPERLQRLMQKHASAGALVPHTRAEVRSFTVLALSAGVCEEIVYRGFMLWFAAMWLGLWPGLLVSSLLFGLAHLYLGWKHVLRTSIAGVFFALVAVASASLWPAIALHAFIDILGGDLGFRSLQV